jgi:hypothetical protein
MKVVVSVSGPANVPLSANSKMRPPSVKLRVYCGSYQ